MRILNGDDIRRTADRSKILAAIRAAFLLQEKGLYTMPDRQHVSHGGVTLLVMPAMAGDAMATKLISIAQENRERGMPVIQGAVLLSDGETGEPHALLDGSSVTALRTGAVGAAGTALISPPEADTLGLIGPGKQGLEQIRFACETRPIRDVHVLGRTRSTVEEFVRGLEPEFPRLNFHICSEARELLEKSQIVVTATNSAEPVLPDDAALLRGKHVVAIGSYTPAMRELPRALFEQLETLYVDVDLARRESGDVRTPLEQGWLRTDQVRRLGSLMTGEGSAHDEGTTCFKSVGMALFDLLAARAILASALEAEAGTEVEFP